MKKDVRAEALDRDVNGGVLACLILKLYRRAQLGANRIIDGLTRSVEPCPSIWFRNEISVDCR